MILQFLNDLTLDILYNILMVGISRGEEMVAGEADVKANTVRSTFRGPTEGRPKSATVQGETKRLDFRGDVETRR